MCPKNPPSSSVSVLLCQRYRSCHILIQKVFECFIHMVIYGWSLGRIKEPFPFKVVQGGETKVFKAKL